MEPIKDVDLKKLVKQCRTEFDKEKQIIEINKKVTVVITPLEAKEHYDSPLRHTGRSGELSEKEIYEHFEKRGWLEENQRWMRP